MRKTADVSLDRRAENLKLLERVLRHTGEGHFNNAIRAKLIAIAQAEGMKAVEEYARSLPDREVCGAIEGWCLAALDEFCREELARLEALKRQQEDAASGPGRRRSHHKRKAEA